MNEPKPMASQRKPTKNHDPNGITVAGIPGEDPGITVARAVLQPELLAAGTLREYGNAYGDLDLDGLIDSLEEQTRATSSGGDLKRADAMLTAQAHTLDAIFNNLARSAINAEYVDRSERFLKLALRAQSQCRATWKTLSAIKNPPAVGYVHQANIAHGPQQVNNASAAPGGDSRAGAGENQNLKNELLEQTDGKRLDTGTTCAPGRTDPAMATVGEVNGAEDRGR